MSQKKTGNEKLLVKGQMNKALSGIRDYLQTHGYVALALQLFYSSSLK